MKFYKLKLSLILLRKRQLSQFLKNNQKIKDLVHGQSYQMVVLWKYRNKSRNMMVLIRWGNKIKAIKDQNKHSNNHNQV
jgi:hypothetical protein